MPRQTAIGGGRVHTGIGRHTAVSGKSRTVSEMNAKILAAARGLEVAQRRALADAAETATTTLNGAIASMVGGDMRMRNAPRPFRPAALRAKWGPGQTGRPSVKVGPSGPVALIDQGAPIHVIGLGRGAAAGAVKKRTRRTVIGGIERAYNLSLDSKRLKINNDVRWGPFIHPGMQGKHRWTTTRDQVLTRTLPPVVFAPHLTAVASAFM